MKNKVNFKKNILEKIINEGIKVFPGIDQWEIQKIEYDDEIFKIAIALKPKKAVAGFKSIEEDLKMYVIQKLTSVLDIKESNLNVIITTLEERGEN